MFKELVEQKDFMLDIINISTPTKIIHYEDKEFPAINTIEYHINCGSALFAFKMENDEITLFYKVDDESAFLQYESKNENMYDVQEIHQKIIAYLENL